MWGEAAVSEAAGVGLTGGTDQRAAGEMLSLNVGESIRFVFYWFLYEKNGNYQPRQTLCQPAGVDHAHSGDFTAHS